MIPAYYQLGMWRVQYFQQTCCVCHIHCRAITKERLPMRRSFFSSLLCQWCHDDVSWLPDALHQQLPVTQLGANHHFVIQPAAAHVGYLRSALIAFKYKQQLSALPILVHAIRQLPRPQGCHSTNSVIVATPTTKHRLATRGFSPLSVLAYYLSRHWKIPLWQGIHRVDKAGSQQGLDRQSRQQNILNAFEVTQAIPTRRVILFDDVVTTAATLTALALTIKQACPETHIMAYALSHGH